MGAGKRRHARRHGARDGRQNRLAAEQRGDFEWLAGPMPGRPVRPAAYAAPFVEQDMAGWDEMFPTILACAYPGPGPHHGAALADHGEAWALPWEVTQAAGEELVLALTGRALPYRLARSASFIAPDALALRYTLRKPGRRPDALHVGRAPAVPGRRRLPDCPPAGGHRGGQHGRSRTAGWGPREARFGWPETAAPDGRRVRLDEVGLSALGSCRKFFALPDARPSWAEVRRVESGHWLRLEWDPQSVPYLGLWVDEGAVNSEAVVAPEPTTGWYDELALAWSKGKVQVLPAGGVQRWRLVVRVGVTMQENEAGRHE